MTTFEELRMAMFNNEPLVWNDPDPIPGADYTITFVEDTSQFEIEDYDMPIFILYGEGSEAQVYLHEIIRK